MIYGVGMLDSAMTWDYASALLQNEFLDRVLMIVEGIRVSEENIAYHVVRDVGPSGEFITHDHTYRHFRRLSTTKLMNRDNREQWEEAGSPDIVELAYERSLDILKGYRPKPRPENVQRELDRIYAEFAEGVKERKKKTAASPKSRPE
jgi:trimethylamine--corrinoid protein Co-methyltransferase